MREEVSVNLEDSSCMICPIMSRGKEREYCHGDACGAWVELDDGKKGRCGFISLGSIAVELIP